MAKAHRIYNCQACGTSYNRWMGKCESCGEWNKIVEELPTQSTTPLHKHLHKKGQVVPFHRLNDNLPTINRFHTPLQEFDRVCGGGFVSGMVLLISGDPGIGKSTLLLQISALVETTTPNITSIYISGEESVEQIQYRAQRCGLNHSNLHLASCSSVQDIIKTLDSFAHQQPLLVVIDSIQTLFIEGIDSSPGSVTQVRQATHELVRWAKRTQSILLLVGHVTKEGAIAGPRVVEHLVDTVLYFEGEKHHQFRMLRALKNRFGPTHELGVFEMNHLGLSEVTNPSSLFLPDSDKQSENRLSGSCVFGGMEGTRPLLCEVQALVGPDGYTTPRRTVVGWDQNRLAMLIAILETHTKLKFIQRDVFLNIAGGLRVFEPALDLAAALSILSSYTQKPLPQGTLAFGEIGLCGEVRPVSFLEQRLKEAKKLGFEHVYLPISSYNQAKIDLPKLNYIAIRHVTDLLQKR